MESTSRPLLLSPQLPRLPGGVRGMGDLTLAAREPCLLPDDFAERPPPLACDPLPPAVAERLAVGEGLTVALESHRQYSELAWCLGQLAQQQQLQQPDQAPQTATHAAPADRQEAERLARAPTPAAQAPAPPGAAAALSSSGSEGRSAPEGRASSGALHLQSRASAVLQLPPPVESEADEADADGGHAAVGGEGPDLDELLEEELAGGAPAGADLAAAAAAAEAPGGRQLGSEPPAAAGQAAASANAAREQAPTGAVAGAAARRRRSRRQQPAPGAGSEAAGGAAVQRVDAAQAQLAEGHAAPPVGATDETAPLPDLADAAAGRAPAGGEPGLPAATQQRGSGPESSDEEEANAAAESDGAAAGEAGASPASPGKRPRPRAQQAAMEAALAKVGEASWQEFCAKLLAAADAREGERGGRGRGGRRGRGRGRGGRGAAPAEVGIQDVLNKNSRVHHAAFAAAYHEAKAALENKEAKRQRKETLQDHSKPGTRWSSMTEHDHAWYLQNKGLALVGPEGKRMELLQKKVAEEQAQYAADVQQRCSAVRYHHCTARQEAQLEEDARARRRRVQRLPRLCRLRALLPAALPSAAAAAGPPQLVHLGCLLRSGEPPRLVPPASEASIPGNWLYLPATGQPGGGGGGGTAAGSGTPGVAKQPYRKAEVPPLAEDSLLVDLAQQARRHNSGAGPAPEASTAAAEADLQLQQPVFCLAATAFAAIVSTPALQGQQAWEIPVTVCAPSEHEAGGPTGGGPMVCLDKPLPQRSLRQRDRQTRLQKYGVLSLGVQWPGQPAAQGTVQDGEPQKAAPQRRSTRSAAAGGPAPPDAATLAGRGAALPPREGSYDAWQLGSRRLLVRAHGCLLLEEHPVQPQEQAAGQQDEAPEQQKQQDQNGHEEAQQEATDGGGGAATQPPTLARRMLLAASTEYLPEPDIEETTQLELCTWRLKLLLRPSVDCLLVAHVHVPKGQVLCCETLTAAELDAQLGGGGGGRGRPWLAPGLALLDSLLGALSTLGPGRYLLLHGAGDEACALLSALPAELEETAGGGAAPLPAAARLTSPSAVYDLHAAHERSGTFDPRLPSSVPPRWRPHDPEVPQVPYTFPPRPGGGKHVKARKRRMAMTRFAWDGDCGDPDQVGHTMQISKADYIMGVEDGL